MEKRLVIFVILGMFLFGSFSFAAKNEVVSSKVRVSMFHAYRAENGITIAANLTNLEARDIMPDVELKIYNDEKLIATKDMELPIDVNGLDVNTTKLVKTTLQNLLPGEYEIEINVFDNSVKKTNYKDKFSL